MVSYLAAQARPAQKQARLLEQREELQRELTESLLGNWLTATDPHAAQQRGQQLLRALQAQAGRHGELLERLLPQRDTLRQLYQQQQHAAPAPTATPAPFGLDIDLFGAPETPAPGEPRVILCRAGIRGLDQPSAQPAGQPSVAGAARRRKAAPGTAG